MDRYLDLNPFYYLSTCALAEKSDQNQFVELINSKRCLVLNIMSTSCLTLLPGTN